MPEHPSRSADGSSARTVVLVVGLTFFLVAWRAFSVGGSALLYGDEHHSIRNLHAPWSEIPALYDQRGTGVAFLVLQKLSVELLGEGLLAYRLPAILAALAAVVVAHPVAKRLVGGTAALLAVPAFATTSLFLYYASLGRAYALVVLLALLWVGAVARACAREEPRGRTYLAVSAWGGLLPWTHLSATATILSVGAAAVGIALAGPGGRRRAARLALALVGAVLVALALYWPARAEVLAFARERTGEGELKFGVLDVAALVVGSRGPAALWGAGVALALVAFLAVERARAVLLAAAVLGPIAGLLVLEPAGAVYAYARYLVVGLPFAAMLLGWLVIEVARRAPLSRPRAELLGLLGGLALVAATVACGPLVRGRALRGPFASSALSLFPLPAFDEPWNAPPEFYRELAAEPGPLRIVEVPQQVSRSALLYRNHWLLHRKDVVIGYVPSSDADEVPRGPYVRVSEEGLADLDADYLIVHVAIERELEAYWLFVHKRASRLGQANPPAYMRAFQNFGTRFDDRAVSLHGLESLQGLERFGAPFYTDPYLVVWKLR